MLKLSNSILQNTIYLIPKYLERILKFPKFLDILGIVFAAEEYYFKNNNQLSYSYYVLNILPSPILISMSKTKLRSWRLEIRLIYSNLAKVSQIKYIGRGVKYCVAMNLMSK